MKGKYFMTHKQYSMFILLTSLCTLLFLSVQITFGEPLSMASDTWTCSNGHSGNTGKFCPICGEARPAQTEGAANLSAEGVIRIYSISNEQLIRNTRSVQYSLGDLKPDEYLSFTFNCTNSSPIPYDVKSAYAAINGGEHANWASHVLDAHSTRSYHIYNIHMGKLGPGTYDVDFYFNDEVITSEKNLKKTFFSKQKKNKEKQNHKISSINDYSIYKYY